MKLSSSIPSLRKFLPYAALLATSGFLGAATINLSGPVGDQVSGLVAYYTFDDASGTGVSDHTNKYNGTLNAGVGALPKWEEGKFGGAIHFDNPTFDNQPKQGHITTAPATGDLNLVNTDFTIGFWIKLATQADGIAQTVWLLDKKGGSTGLSGWAMGLGRDAKGGWALYLYGQNTSTYTKTRFTTLNDNDWHHIGIVFDNTTKEVLFTLDGVVLALDDKIASPFSGVSAANGNSLMIGQRNVTAANAGTNIDFLIDDLFISNEKHAFVIPEASTVMLLGIGCLFLLKGSLRR